MRQKLKTIKTKSSKAIQILEEAAHADSLDAKKELRKLASRGIAFQERVRPWNVAPTGIAAILGIAETFSADKSYKTAMQLLKEVKDDERNLYKSGSLFHVSRIENLQQAVPGYWRAVFNSRTYIHDGLDFVTIRDGKEKDFSLCWSAVEYFHLSQA